MATSVGTFLVSIAVGCLVLAGVIASSSPDASVYTRLAAEHL